MPKRVKAEKRTAKVLERERKAKMKGMLDVFLAVYKEWGYVEVSDLEDAGFSYDQVRYYYGGLKGLGEAARQAKPALFLTVEQQVAKQAEKEEAQRLAKEQREQEKLERERAKAQEIAQRRAEREKTQKELVEVYADIAEIKGYASMADLKAAGFSKHYVQEYAGNLRKLNAMSRVAFPEKFFDTVVDDYIHDPEYMERLRDVIDTYQRFVVVTAITGCRVDERMLGAVEAYCRDNDAHCLVLMASDPAHNYFDPGADYGTIDRQIVESDCCTLVVEDSALNKNFNLSTVKLSAKQIDPATSMERIAADLGTFCFGSPKQRLKAVATSANDFPHFVMTSGSITISDYTSENYMSARTAFLADYDHVMGGLIIEIVNEKWFHFRQFQMSLDGSFSDLGWRYHADEDTRRNAPLAFVLGDWHSGSTDPTAAQAWKEVMKYTGAKSLVLHDAFDGRAINHHERFDKIKRAQRANNNLHVLRQEVKGLVDDLKDLAEVTPENIYLVKSNHDEVLIRYLKEGYYVEDPVNHRYSLPLAIEAMDGGDPLQAACELENGGALDKVVWWKRTTDFKVNGVTLSSHGDKGPKGARGTLNNLERSLTVGVIGHSHEPGILRGMFQVGCSCYLQLDYNAGDPSGWLHSSCLVYEDGTRQLINSFDGSWRLDEDYQICSM